MPTPTTSQSMRADLLAPEPIKRVYALHALEVELELEGAVPARLVREVKDFAARGVPYYAPHDPDYCEWVGKAVTYWERMHAGLQNELQDGELGMQPGMQSHGRRKAPTQAPRRRKAG